MEVGRVVVVGGGWGRLGAVGGAVVGRLGAVGGKVIV